MNLDTDALWYAAGAGLLLVLGIWYVAHKLEKQVQQQPDPWQQP